MTGRPKGRKDSAPRREPFADFDDEIDALLEAAAEETRRAAAEASQETALAAAGAAPSGTRRQRKPINWLVVQGLVEIGCTDEEVASNAGVSLATLVGEKNGGNTPRAMHNAAIYRAIKARFAFRAPSSIRRKLWQFMRGVLTMPNPADPDGKPITVPVPLGLQFAAAQFLARQRQYLGFDQPPPPEQEPDGMVRPGMLVVVVKDKSVLEPSKPVPPEVMRALTIRPTSAVTVPTNGDQRKGR